MTTTLLTTLANNLISREKLAVLLSLPLWISSNFLSVPDNSGFAQIPTSQLPNQIGNVVLTEAKTISLNQATYSLNRFLGAQKTTAKYEVLKYNLHFELEIDSTKKTTIQAEIFYPINSSLTPLPLIVYAPGTTGLEDNCAPTRESDSAPKLGNYENQMIAMASQGYVIAMPNYIGLDDPNIIQPYFHKESEAKVLLNTAQALITLTSLKDKISPKIFFGGYSQGGHAAFSAADFYNPINFAFEFGGVFGHGPTNNTKELLWNNPNLSPYFAKAYQSLYSDFQAENMFLKESLFQVDRSLSLCVHQAFAFNSSNVNSTYNQEFKDALKNNNFSTEQLANIGNRLEENHAGTTYKNIPTLLLQGTGDPIVTIENQADFAKSLCNRQIPLQFNTYNRVHHFQTRQVSFWDTLEWVDQIFTGNFSGKSYCG